MTIDYWYSNRKAAFADCTFYPADGVYRGNIYNSSGKPIGDYSSKNSVEVEKHFPGIFGN